MSEADEHRAYEALTRRQMSYKLALNAPGVQEMLQDLAPYCRAVRGLAPEQEGETMDPIRMAILVGRQQVWERIMHHLHLTPEQLYALYTGRKFQIGEDK